MRRVIEYNLKAPKLSRSVTLLLLGDLHNEPWEDLLPLLEGPQALLIVGDLGNRYKNQWKRSLDFLQVAAQRLPVFVSVGNHDLALTDFEAYADGVRVTGARLLCDGFEPFGEMAIGGYYQPPKESPAYALQVSREKNPLSGFSARREYRILLCHRPEQAVALPESLADLILCGHAHGGQIRVLGHGLYAPGQGVLPRYTHGLYLGRILVTSGAGNPVGMPRWGNPREAVRLVLEGESPGKTP